MKRYLRLFIGAIVSISNFAQTQVQKYNPGITEEGITYFLPTTQVRVVVHATKTHHIPGEFCEYAKRFLRMDNVPLNDFDEWNIDNIELYSFGVADKTKAYSIKLNTKTSAPLVTLSPDGRLISINKKLDDYEAGIPDPEVVRIEKEKLNANDFKTEEILAAGSKSKMAELTANEIYNIRENRSLLSKGQADFMPKDGEQLRLMLNRLDVQEEGLLQLFKGETTVEKHTIAFDINPTQDVNQAVLFSFSKYLGIVDKDDPAGIPFYFSIKDTHSLPTSNIIEEKPKKEIKDLRYVIPSRVNVKIFTDKEEYASEAIPMAQFGRVEHLGGELFNKKYTTRITLSPETGGILHVEAEKPE